MTEVTVFVCGTKCDHDWSGDWVELKDGDGRPCGGSATCTKCGVLAIDAHVQEGE